MLVRRVIEKEVNCCNDCPYHNELNEMGATIHFCEAIPTPEDDIWESRLSDIHWGTYNKIISKFCPLNKG